MSGNSKKHLSLRQVAESELDIVAKYIKTNDKSLVKTIIDYVERVPELQNKLEEAKKSVRFLYRGIPIDKNLTEEAIIDHEKNQDFVATSKSEIISIDYSKGKDVLNGKDEVTAVKSVLLTYEVLPEDVILDLCIFDEKRYGTVETLINPKTAKLIKYQEIKQ